MAGKDTMRILKIMIVMLIMVTLMTMSYSCKKSKDTSKVSTTPAPTNVTASNVQMTCPVEGGKIDKSVYVDYQGKRVYFCCSTTAKSKTASFESQYTRR